MNANPEKTLAPSASPIPGPRQIARLSRLWLLFPGLAFIAVLVVLAIGLGRDPRYVPSPLIGKPVPEFALPAVQGRTLGLSSEDLRGDVSIVNVFASWCVACRQEHPLLLDIAREGTFPVHGLNYKDRPEDAAAWLDALGDPYTRTGADIDGRVGIDWGVYGVPETFLVDRSGHIAFKHVGPITPAVVEEQLLPRARALAARPAGIPRVQDGTDGTPARSGR